jgi:DNA-binding NarL/FixJ family response regulator
MIMTPPATRIRVLLADDHPVVRNGIQKILSRDPEIEIVGQACRGDEALEKVAELLPDVLLLDMEMPGMNGVNVTLQVRRRFPSVHVLALSGYDDRAYVMETLQNGASGYLMKDEDMDIILAAVKGVARGETGWLSRRISALISSWMRKEDPASQSLTQRELEVLRLVVAGRTNQRIALELHISEKTIEKYLESILRKLGVNSRVEAAVYAVRNNLLAKPNE